MDVAISVFSWGEYVMVERRVRVRVEMVGVGGGGGKTLRVGWEVVVRIFLKGAVDAGSRMERVVMMVRVPSIGVGLGGGFAVLGSCDLELDEPVMGLSMGRYMVETRVIQDVEFVSSAGWQGETTGVCEGGTSGPTGVIGSGTRRVACVMFAEPRGPATLFPVWFCSCSFAQDESWVGRL